jgi:hypothetical protein
MNTGSQWNAWMEFGATFIHKFSHTPEKYVASVPEILDADPMP